MGDIQGNISGTVSQRGRASNISAQFSMTIPGASQVKADLQGITSALDDLKRTLQNMSTSQTFMTTGFTSMLKGIQKEAAATHASLRDLSGSLGGMGGGGMGGSIGAVRMPGPGGSGSGNAAYAQAWSSDAGRYNTSGGGGQAGAGGQSAAISGAGSTVGGAVKTATSSLLGMIPGGAAIGGLMDVVSDFAMLPLRYIRERVQNNRVPEHRQDGGQPEERPLWHPG